MTATLAQLEQRIAALEGDEQGDQLNPNVLTINPDGTIAANLTGHLAAQGVDLPAGTSGTPPANSRVRWLRTSDQAVIADLTGYDAAGSDFSLLSTYGQPGNNATAQVLATDARGGSNRASVGGRTYGAPSNAQEAFANAGANNYIIIDGAGNSNFLQLLFTGNHQVAFGVSTNTWAAAQNSAAKVIPHGLGKSPIVALATYNAGNGLVPQVAFNATNLTVVGTWVGGNLTGTYGFSWIAIS